MKQERKMEEVVNEMIGHIEKRLNEIKEKCKGNPCWIYEHRDYVYTKLMNAHEQLYLLQNKKWWKY